MINEVGYPSDLPRYELIPTAVLMDSVEKLQYLLGFEYKEDSPWNQILSQEILLILIRDVDDYRIPETEELVELYLNQQITHEQYKTFKQSVVGHLGYYVKRIIELRYMWREHCDIHINVKPTENAANIMLVVVPIVTTPNLHTLLLDEVKKIQDSGGFVPYKYLRIVGLLG